MNWNESYLQIKNELKRAFGMNVSEDASPAELLAELEKQPAHDEADDKPSHDEDQNEALTEMNESVRALSEKVTANENALSALTEQVSNLAGKVNDIAAVFESTAEKEAEEKEETEKKVDVVDAKIKELADQINGIKATRSGGKERTDEPPAIPGEQGSSDKVIAKDSDEFVAKYLSGKIN